MRNRLLFLGLAVALLAGGRAFAGEEGNTKKAHRLEDRQLDRITAGHTDGGNSAQDRGGAIVAAGSEATISNSGSVSLDGGSQQGARALNLVNAAQSRVANGVNVWDGRMENQTEATELKVQQGNQVVQQGNSGYASLPGYQRTDANVSSSYSSSEHSQTSSTDKFTNDSNVDTRQIISTSNGSSSVGDMASPTPNVDLKAGQGISGTGKLDIHVDAGSVDVGVAAGASVKTEFEGTLGATHSNTAQANYKADLHWDLPKLDLSFDGGICYVELGTCSAKGSRESTSSAEADKQASYSQVVHAPVAVQDAKAEYIVVDESKLTATTNYSVILKGNSQQDARAFNLINAAGSLIANAVNVARTPTVGPVLNLNQTNLIVQSH